MKRVGLRLKFAVLFIMVVTVVLGAAGLWSALSQQKQAEKEMLEKAQVLAQDADAEQLERIQLLLKQPYFAKVALQFNPGQEPKELYIGTAGISDESYRRLVVDWRSPVAEVYYNQDLSLIHI